MTFPFILGLITWLYLARLYLRQFFTNHADLKPSAVVSGVYKEFVLKILLILMAVFCFGFQLGSKNSLIFIAGLVTMNSVFLMYRIYKL